MHPYQLISFRQHCFSEAIRAALGALSWEFHHAGGDGHYEPFTPLPYRVHYSGFHGGQRFETAEEAIESAREYSQAVTRSN